MTLRAANAGMTLTEMLVVLVIVAVMASAAVLSLNSLGDRTPQSKTATQFAALVRHASDKAVMQGAQLGIEISSNGYQAYVHTPSSWQPIKGGKIFSMHHVSDNTMLQLSTTDSPHKLASTPPGAMGSGGREDTLFNVKQNADKQVPHPQILVLSTGYVTPFSLTVSNTGQGKDYYVSADASGHIQVSDKRDGV